MLLGFAGGATLAYLSLCHLVAQRWLALGATLLAFSSSYCLYYNDMISSEVASLFGMLLTFPGMVPGKPLSAIAVQVLRSSVDVIEHICADFSLCGLGCGQGNNERKQEVADTAPPHFLKWGRLHS